MHELRLCEAIVDRAVERARERPVARVRIRVGRLHHVHSEAFDQSFAIAAAGGVGEDAVPELVLLPVRASCRGCGSESKADEIVFACSECGGLEIELTGGTS